MLTTDISAQWGLTLPGPAPGTPPRSPGIHVSDLVRAAAVDLGLLEPDETPGQFNRVSINRMCAGLAFEEWYQKQIPASAGLVYHGGELAWDGVSGSPDAWQYPQTWHEFKFSWKSANTPVAKYWYWLSQIQAYLYMGGKMWGEPERKFAVLHVYHVMGDYRGSGPIHRVTGLEFSQIELAENWTLLGRYRGKVEEELKRKVNG